MGRTDNRYISDVVGDQLKPSKNEGGHEHLADADVGLHDRLHFFGTKFEYFASFTHARAYQRAAAGKHIQFASELSRLVLHDG